MSDSLKDVTFQGYDLASGHRVSVLYTHDGLRLDEGCAVAVPAADADALQDEHGDNLKVAAHKKDSPRATRLPRGAGEPPADALVGAVGVGSTSTQESSETGA